MSSCALACSQKSEIGGEMCVGVTFWLIVHGSCPGCLYMYIEIDWLVLGEPFLFIAQTRADYGPLTL